MKFVTLRVTNGMDYFKGGDNKLIKHIFGYLIFSYHQSIFDDIKEIFVLKR